jgi:tetratricopeptide (TPR) repeat protein
LEFRRKKIQDSEDIEAKVKLESETASAEDYFNEAQKCLEQNDWERAFHYLNKTLESDAQNHEALFLRGQYHHHRQDFEQALQNYRQALKLNADTAEYHFQRGLVYVQKKSFEIAVFDFSNAIKLKENEANYHLERALAYEALGQTDNLLFDLNLLIKLNPNLEIAYFKRACVFLEKKNLVAAKQDFEQVKRINPSKTQECELKLLAYLANDEEYRRFQRIAEEQARKEAEANELRSKADEFLLQKKYTQAQQMYDKALAVNPLDYKSYIGKGQAFYHTGDTVNAIASFNKATELDSEALKELLNLGLNVGLNNLAESFFKKFFK